MPDQDVILLPPALRVLAKMAADTEMSLRWPSTMGVRLVQKDGLLIAESVQGHSLCRVTVPIVGLVTAQPTAPEGRFPKIEPAAPTGPPARVVKVDPRLLLRLVRAAVEVSHCNSALIIEIYGETDPIVLRLEGDDGRAFFGLLSPIFPFDLPYPERSKPQAVGEPGA